MIHLETLTPRLIFKLLFRLTAIVLCAEIIVMLLFDLLELEQLLSQWQAALADGLLLILLSSYPALIWVIKPILNAVNASMKKTAMLAAALEQAGESVIITKENGTILYVNQAFEATTGYSYGESVGNNPRFLQSGKQSSEFYQQMWQALTTKGEWNGELWNRRKDDQIYPETLHIRSVKDDDGQFLYYIGTFSDITERLEMEKSARQNQKMEALGTLVGGVAHNFNNILSGIIGKSYLARKKTDSEDALRHLDDINKLSQTGSTLIRQLLAFTQDANHDKQGIPIVTLFEETVKTARLGIPENIQVITSFPHDEMTVFGDASQLQQAIFNLISNARDAVEHSETKLIRINLRHTSCNECVNYRLCDTHFHDIAELVVEDSGCGISPADIEQIFDPFFSTKEQGKGMGLGLSMTKGIIESQGGLIRVHSTVGKGSTFSICIPLIDVNALSANNGNPVIIDSQHHDTILVVDDEKTIRSTVSQVLVSLGYKALIAENGHDGFNLFTKHQGRIRLVITDVVMPDISGIEMLKNIRSQTPEIAAILMTGYEPTDLAIHAAEDEATELIRKPLNVATLSQAVAKMLNN